MVVKNFFGAEEWDENAPHTTTSVMTCSVTIEEK